MPLLVNPPFMTAVAFVLTLHDALFTVRRMEKYGPQVEMNPLVKYLIQKGGSIVGAVANGVVFPSIAIVAGLDYFGWDHLLAFYVGVRSWLAISQMASLRFEAQVDAGLQKIRQESSVPPPTPTVKDHSVSKSVQIPADPQGEEGGPRSVR